jgi:hypothetical protein
MEELLRTNPKLDAIRAIPVLREIGQGIYPGTREAGASYLKRPNFISGPAHLNPPLPVPAVSKRHTTTIPLPVQGNLKSKVKKSTDSTDKVSSDRF